MVSILFLIGLETNMKNSDLEEIEATTKERTKSLEIFRDPHYDNKPKKSQYGDNYDKIFRK